MARPDKYKTNVEPYLNEIKQMCLSMTEAQIAETLGVSLAAWKRYKSHYEPLRAVLKKGRQTLVVELRSALIRRAKCFQYEERKVIKDDMMGWIYLKDSIQTERALAVVKQLNSFADFKDMEKALLQKQAYIKEVKEDAGLGAKPDSYYLAYAMGKETGRTTEESLQTIENICTHTGIGPAEYYRWGLQEFSEVRALREARKHIRVEKRKKYLAKTIGKAYGMKPAEVLADCNAKGVSLNDDYWYGLSRFKGDEFESAISEVRRIRELAAAIKEDTYASPEISEKTKADIAEIYDLTRRLLSEAATGRHTANI